MLTASLSVVVATPLNLLLSRLLHVRLLLRFLMRRKAYGAVETSLKASGVLRGALFWEWLSDGESATDTGVRETDSTWQCAPPSDGHPS